MVFSELGIHSTKMETQTLVLSPKQMDQKIDRIAFQIYENNHEEQEIVMAGIASNGFELAELLAERLEKISPIKTKLVNVKLNKRAPLESESILDLDEGDLEGKVVILVDDVLNSGKTLIYGVKRFLRTPLKRLRTVALVDRDHKRYPVRADYIGMSLSTTLLEHVTVVTSGPDRGVYLA